MSHSQMAMINERQRKSFLDHQNFFFKKEKKEGRRHISLELSDAYQVGRRFLSLLNLPGKYSYKAKYREENKIFTLPRKVKHLIVFHLKYLHEN